MAIPGGLPPISGAPWQILEPLGTRESSARTRIDRRCPSINYSNRNIMHEIFACIDVTLS